MKQLIIFLATFFLSSLMHAVTITEQQRQEALNTTRTFCSLISQYSSGGSSSLDLDQRIFAMSSEDMEAYDNLVSHRHVRFDNFLALITNKFNNKITLEYSDYRIESVNPIYSYSMVTSAPVILQNNLTSYDWNTVSADKLQDIYIIISVKNKVPSLRGADHDYKIIYSVMTKKIMSYTDSQGGLICFANAMYAMSSKKYEETFAWIDKALTHERFTAKKECYMLGYHCALLSGDIGRVRKYAQLLNSPYLVKLADLWFYIIKSQFNQTTLNLAKQLYKEKCSLFSSYAMAEVRSSLALFVVVCNAEMKNYGEVLHWYDEALKWNPNNNYAKYGKALCLTTSECGTRCEIYDPRVMSLLKSSADGGFIPSYLELALCYMQKAVIEQNDDDAIDNLNNANYYLDKALKENHIYAYVVRGIWDIRISDDMTKKKQGLSYLKKAHQSPNLDEAIPAFAENFDFLPSSREELGQIIAKYEREGLTSSTISSDASASSHSQQNQSSGSSHPQYQISSSGSSSSTHPSTSTSSTHYNYNKPRRRRSHGPFNAAKTEAFGGFVMGYVQKQWQQHADGESAKFGFWEGHRVVPGIRFGFCYNPQIKYGFGVNSGLNYEFYWSKTNDIEGYKGLMMEHVLSFPFHLEYRANFSKWFQLFVYGGFSFDCGVLGKMVIKDGSEEIYKNENIYKSDDAPDWKRFNITADYGAGFRVNNLQFTAGVSRGLLDMSSSSDYTIKQNRPLHVDLTIMF